MQKSTLHRANLLCVICTTAILFTLNQTHINDERRLAHESTGHDTA